MALGIFEVREIVERAFAQQDVLDACARRDLGRVIMILGAQGLTQGRISELTGISQGRLSEWARHKRKPRASSVFEAFADGLGVPPTAREALGLASDGSAEPGLSRPRPARDRTAPPAQALPTTAGPISSQPPRVPAEGVAGLLAMETVQGPLNDVMAALEAQQSRRAAGSAVRRPVWKNLVFTGGPGTSEEDAAAKVQGEFGRPYGYFGSWKTTTSEVDVIEAEQTTVIGPVHLSNEGPYLLSIKDAAKALGISYSTLYQMTAQGDIEWVMIGSRKYISRESLMDFIKANTHKGYYVAR